MHGNLDWTDLLLDLPDKGFDGLVVGDITHVALGTVAPTTEQPHGFVELGGVSGADHRPAPTRSQLAGDEQAEAARSSGDEGDRLVCRIPLLALGFLS
jgi:hypothetical protein